MVFLLFFNAINYSHCTLNWPFLCDLELGRDSPNIAISPDPLTLNHTIDLFAASLPYGQLHSLCNSYYKILIGLTQQLPETRDRSSTRPSMTAMLINDSEPMPQRLTCSPKLKKTMTEIPWKGDIGYSVTGVTSVSTRLIGGTVPNMP